MAKIMVIYQDPKEVNEFKSYYENNHMALVKDVPNVKHAEVNYVAAAMNTDKPYFLTATMSLNQKNCLKTQCSHQHGRKYLKMGRT
ncbi:EthD family reductase [Pseudalkalibacillus hwajinpoensis]|uniref:EthD family reductase n=1 Tax=Guptibacillus hwajinpoensis TaxID=208199 RepID=UPI00325BAF00